MYSSRSRPSDTFPRSAAPASTGSNRQTTWIGIRIRRDSITATGSLPHRPAPQPPPSSASLAPDPRFSVITGLGCSNRPGVHGWIASDIDAYLYPGRLQFEEPGPEV